MNGSALPQLQQQTLDAATLEEYQTDLEHLCDIFEVKVRTSSARQEPLATVADALLELRDGKVRGVQVRYRYGGQHWLDTLLPTASGIRLTRICLDDA